MKRYMLNSRVAADNFDDELIIANLDSGLYYTLNGTVLNVIKMLPIEDPKKVILTISEQFNEKKQEVIDDLNQIWDELLDEKLIVESEKVNNKTIDIEVPTEFTPSKLNRYADMQDLLLLDPIHEVDEEGWPVQENEKLADETSG